MQADICFSENADWHSWALMSRWTSSSRFIRHPPPGSNYPWFLNPTRKLPASNESASLQFIATHTRAHTHPCLKIKWSLFVWVGALAWFMFYKRSGSVFLGDPQENRCDPVHIVRHLAGLWLIAEMILSWSIQNTTLMSLRTGYRKSASQLQQFWQRSSFRCGNDFTRIPITVSPC